MVRMHLSTALNDELYSIGCRQAKRDIARDSITDLRSVEIRGLRPLIGLVCPGTEP
jgi:hypothetical protein